MAVYKYPGAISQNSGAAFDEVLQPGFMLAISGIYRCVNCGDEIAANKGDPLPPQNHHQHNPLLGRIGWQLAVATTSRI